MKNKNVGHFLAFNKQWFKKHQTILLWLLNTSIINKWFKWILCIRRCDIGYDKNIISILPHAYTVQGEKENQYITDFRTHPKYAKRIYFAFKYLWWVLHYWDLIFVDRFIPYFSFGFATLTVYPDPNPEVTTVDGTVLRSAGNEDWSVLRNGAGTTGSDTDTTNTVILINVTSTTDKWNGLNRSIFLFDTSSLGSGTTVADSVLSLRGRSKSDPISITPNIDIYTSTPASNTALVAGDFTQIGTTSQTGSPITYANFSTTAYNAFTFNATGRGNVSLTGISKFGARNVNYDVDNIAPTWSSPGPDSNSDLEIDFADVAGTATDPKLVITYGNFRIVPPNKLRPRIFAPGIAR